MSSEANPNNPSDHTVLADILDRLLDQTGTNDVSVNDVVSAFEDRGFGAMITVVGLIAAAPVIGAIPGISILTGSLVILIAAQFIFGRPSPWIPATLGNRSIDANTLQSGIEKARPYATWLDNYVKRRVNWLVRGTVQRRIIAIVVCILAVTMFPLAFIPWGVQPPATAIMLFGIAMVGRDGAFAIAAYSLVILTAFVIFAFWGTIASTLASVSGLLA